MDEIVFSYNNTRCHAKEIKALSGDEVYIGTMYGCDIYQIPSVIFDQFGFVFH